MIRTHQWVLAGLLAAASAGVGCDEKRPPAPARAFSLESAIVGVAFDESVVLEGESTARGAGDIVGIDLTDAGDLLAADLDVRDAAGNTTRVRVELESLE